jgi:hypothetical protein
MTDDGRTAGLGRSCRQIVQQRAKPRRGIIGIAQGPLADSVLILSAEFVDLVAQRTVVRA